MSQTHLYFNKIEVKCQGKSKGNKTNMDSLVSEIISKLLDGEEYSAAERKMIDEVTAEVERVIIEPLEKLDAKLGCQVATMIGDMSTKKLIWGLEEGFKYGYKFAMQLQKECRIK
jgi:hypothetical protein